MPMAKGVTTRRGVSPERLNSQGDGSSWQKQHNNASPQNFTGLRRSRLTTRNVVDNVGAASNIIDKNGAACMPAAVDASTQVCQHNIQGSATQTESDGVITSPPSPFPSTQPPSLPSIKTSAEEIMQEIYRCHAGPFFEELKSWFVKEALVLREAAERQMETSQTSAIRDRVDQLEATVAALRAPAPTGGVAPGKIAPGSASKSSMFSRDAQVSPLSRVRSTEAINASNEGWGAAVEKAFSQAATVQERMFHSEVADLRATVERSLASAAVAELGRLDAAFRASLAAEVRELGSMCENVRARVEALDASAAEHISRLDARIDAIGRPQDVGVEIVQPDGTTLFLDRRASSYAESRSGMLVHSAQKSTVRWGCTGCC